MKCLALFVLLTISLGVSASAQKIEQEYDKFKAHTLTRLTPVKVYDKGRHHIQLAASFITKDDGKILGVFLSFYSTSPSWRYLHPPNFLALIDGKRENFGALDRLSSNVSSRPVLYGSGVYVRETLSAIINVERFQSMANAAKVEMQIGGAEFEIKEKHLAAMKEFAARLSKKEPVQTSAPQLNETPRLQRPQ